MKDLSHINNKGKAAMVDVSGKSATLRQAVARCRVLLNQKAFSAVKGNLIEKGDVLSVARIGAIQAGKKTSELIPLCHNIFINNISIDFELNDIENSIEIIASARTEATTGIEMEALTSVAVAGLIIYDMCKAVDKSIRITDIELLSKSGGKSGEYRKRNY
ncbi:MAG: molybdenum cofactor biosynthesis protein [Ignavibacteria bacterium]|nr:molybdenum cofactor biosynthesis protein [Ignavibacteria bacterium]